MTTDHLKFSTDILVRLGEELNPHPDQGLLELARNSYDADASTCSVELSDPGQSSGSITIVDDGVGMNAEDISKGWLVLGRSSKTENEFTSKLGRRIIGHKGLGRLAALRLGRIAKLLTRPEGSSEEFSLTIDWSKFDQVRTVEDVELTIVRRARDRSQPDGTAITISELRSPLAKTDVTRLARSLLLLSDPFQHSSGFVARLVAPEYRDLENLVKQSYFQEAEYHLNATIDAAGKIEAKVFDFRDSILFRTTAQDDIKLPSYVGPHAEFDLYLFILRPMSLRNATLTEVRDWLKAFGGVYLYHNGLRVQPYGDRGYDWLDLNLARAASPELRPSTNTSIGKVAVDDPDHLLRQKTDRNGFIENTAFSDLKSFASAVLRWLAKQRLRLREEAKGSARVEVPRDVRTAKLAVETALEKVKPGQRKQLSTVFEKYERARQKEVKSLRDELLLYRTLSTVGTTTAVLAHEVRKPVEQITSMARLLDRRARSELKETYEELFQNPIEYILRSSAALSTFANVTVKLLDRDKRRKGKVPINDVVTGVIELFRPFLDEAKVACKLTLPEEQPYLFGTIASLESILANLITNSLNAFLYEHARQVERTIEIKLELQTKQVKLSVLDNGPGIVDISTRDIWLPGETTTPGGTGLGLTIVRDAVSDLGGTVGAIASGGLGGAEIYCELPILSIESKEE